MGKGKNYPSNSFLLLMSTAPLMRQIQFMILPSIQLQSKYLFPNRKIFHFYIVPNKLAVFVCYLANMNFQFNIYQRQ